MKYFYLCLVSAFLIGCSKEDDSTNSSYASNDAEIIAYLEANSISATKTGSGLYYFISKQGTGASPVTSSAVRVAYKGYFTSGRVFDQRALVEDFAKNDPYVLHGVVKHWVISPWKVVMGKLI